MWYCISISSNGTRMLFHKKHQKKIQLIWKIIVLLIAVSMVLLYATPAFR